MFVCVVDELCTAEELARVVGVGGWGVETDRWCGC